MTRFELAYSCLRFFLPPLHNKIRRIVFDLANPGNGRDEILDVGGRKSHYTIGVPGHITITDLPRETDVQKSLNLGVTPDIASQVMQSRSNIRRVIFDDMTRSALPSNSFDGAIAVEVLEHVEADRSFVREVYRVLKPGGWFVMSTPNGDYLRNTNPDHKRHYSRQQLRELLSSRFAIVEVEYAIESGACRKLGLLPWSPGRPVQTALSIFGNVVNSLQSAGARLN
ncbi:MAG: methyltransferase domain-containing protein, partial [Gammaproteobacteria bacterium]